MIRAATLDVALSLRHEDLELLKSIVQNFVPLSSVIIYGSRCNGTARDTSDIDLLLLDSSITPLNVSELREQLDESATKRVRLLFKREPRGQSSSLEPSNREKNRC